MQQKKELRSLSLRSHRSPGRRVWSMPTVVALAAIAAGLAASAAAPVVGLDRLTGTYAARITGQEPVKLNGSWRIQFLANGTTRTLRNGVTVVRGKASGTASRFTITDISGSYACSVSGPTGVYRWLLQGRRLTFTPLQDPCVHRRTALTVGRWTKVA